MKKFKDHLKEERLQEFINIPKIMKRFKEANKPYAKAVPEYVKRIKANNDAVRKQTHAHIAAQLARELDFDARLFISFLDKMIMSGLLDQNVQMNVLRKKRKAGYNPRMRLSMNEEQIEELSKKKLHKYMDGAGKSLQKAAMDYDDDKADKRMKGIDKAADKAGYGKNGIVKKSKDAGKIMGKKMYEEEQIDELSTKMLKKYSAANRDEDRPRGKKSSRLDKMFNTKKHQENEKNKKKSEKRSKYFFKVEDEIEKRNSMKEDAPVNATGAAVPGTGDTGQVWGTKHKTYRVLDRRFKKGRNRMLKKPKRDN